MAAVTLHRILRPFYLRSPLVVARDLLGLFMVRKVGRKRLIGKIVEVEAYMGEVDPASHSYRGESRRNAVMFGEGGHLYVYFTYGMHYCCNVVTEPAGIPHAVLIRALEPIEGLELMALNRGLVLPPSSARRQPALINLCNGPGKLCQALGIARVDNGSDLCTGPIWIGRARGKPRRFKIGVSTRVGISSGKEHLWRFFIKGSPFVSRGRPVSFPEP